MEKEFIEKVTEKFINYMSDKDLYEDIVYNEFDNMEEDEIEDMCCFGFDSSSYWNTLINDFCRLNDYNKGDFEDDFWGEVFDFDEFETMLDDAFTTVSSRVLNK